MSEAPSEQEIEERERQRETEAKNRQAIVYAESKQQELAKSVFKDNARLAENTREISRLEDENFSLTRSRDMTAESYETLATAVWILRQDHSTEEEKAYARGTVSRYTGVRHFR